ncbi:GntR family transcriptional regulator [Streptomyces stelliscabiei]|uniref:GntR family transcriptional regulator n=1 Tax=Streptomyces stelliscabiei TaxID=146820 RepID=UPI002FF23295
MEQAGPRSRQAAPRAPEAAARPASAYRVPAQPGVADVDRERGITADGGGAAVRGDTGGVTDAARGEHTHSETPIPLPRTPERPVLQRSSVRGQILDALRAALAGGELTPGEVYSAPALGERFGVSATPVREAMQQLAIEGAVEVVPNRGFRVVRRGARELAELAEVRALLQVPVVMRLARTVPADRWGELRPLADETARAASTGCRATYGEADRAFHRGVLGLAGNEQLLQIADDLHRRTQLPLGGGHLGDVGSGGRVELMADAAEHIALLDALMAEDLEAACCLVEKHFGAVG